MAWAYETVSDATIRSLASIPVDALAVKVRISNQFGTSPLVVGSASIGRSTGGPALAGGSPLPLRFGGASSVTVPVGGSAVSDAVAMRSSGPQTVAVSVFVQNLDGITSHYPCCEAATPSYMTAPGSGDLTASSAPDGFGYQAAWSRLVDAVDVERPTPPAGTPAARGSIVVIGDSISDGFNSTGRWTDDLQDRIATLPAGEQVAVVDEGNTANTLTAVVPSFAATGGGPPGVDRLPYDALDFPGVATVVMFLGTNDLYFGATAAAVIQGLQQSAAAIKAAGLRAVAVTLLPRAGSEGWDATRQSSLDQVNQWLRTSGTFDAVVDLGPAVADVDNGACTPTALDPAFDSGDHLHPNAAGAAAMADAIDPAALGLPSLPSIPTAVQVRATPGCAAGS